MWTRKGLWFMAVATVALLAGSVGGAPFEMDGSLDLGRPGDDPLALGSATENAPGDYTVSGGGSDWWGAGEYAHFAYQEVTGDFWIEGDVQWVNRTGNWGDMDGWVKAGLAVRNDVDNGAGNEKEVNYFNANLRPGHGPDGQDVTFQWRDVATAGMNSTKSRVNPDGGDVDTRRIALNRWTDAEGDSLMQAFFWDGSQWVEQGGTRWAWNLNETAYVGLAVTAHKNTTWDHDGDGGATTPEIPLLETANFTNVDLTGTAVTPTGDLPRKPGDPIADPEGVAPVMGGWGVLEVVDNGNMGNVNDAARSIEDGGGTRHTYNLMGAININDSDPQSNAKNFGGDGPYGVAEAGIKTKGSVDDIAFLARGQVEIPEAGDWTFYINSDDGEELVIDGNRDWRTGSGGWNDNNFLTVNLSAGPHDIRVLHREDGGGANVEVAAAKGNTTDLSKFRLIGSGDAGIPAHESVVPAIANVNLEQTPAGWNDPTGTPPKTKPESRATAITALQEASDQTVLLTGTDTVINHTDLDGNPNAGAYGGDHAYLNDAAGNDENDHAFRALADLLITEAGTYYLGYNSDDGASLEIKGQNWLQVMDGSHGNATILDDGDGDAADDVLQTDAWTGWSYTVGEIDLAVGTYALEFISYEGGDGAFSEVFGGSSIYGLRLLTDTEQRFTVEVADALELTPEPATLALVGLGALGTFLARRRRR
jgi:hypothetical protein